MIDYTLKNKVDATFKMMDDIYNSDPLLTQATGMTCREMLKYNLLQFVGFLFESDGTDGRLELDFIRDYLGTIMSIGQFLNFKYGKCMDNNYINTPPRVLLYTAKYDMSGGVKASTGRPISKEIVELFKDLGTAFIAINDETVRDYFSDEYFKDKAQLYIPNLDASTRAFLVMREYCDKHDIEIYNATRGGRLEVFQRVDLDKVLDNL